MRLRNGLSVLACLLPLVPNIADRPAASPSPKDPVAAASSKAPESKPSASGESGPGTSVPSETVPTVQHLGWLAGCWRGEGKTRSYEEHWMKPEGGTLLGVSRTISEGRTVEHEFLQIRERDGAVFYIANPSGQSEASFKLVESVEGRAVFTNPEHDFPQRIIYLLEAGGRLTAAIEGTSGGKARRSEFPMQRTACD